MCRFIDDFFFFFLVQNLGSCETRIVPPQNGIDQTNQVDIKLFPIPNGSPSIEVGGEGRGKGKMFQGVEDRSIRSLKKK